MDNLNNKTINVWLAISYKLLNDIVCALLAVFTLLLISEGIIPGFISAHLNITKLAIIIFAVLGLIAYLGGKLKIESAAPRKANNKWIIFLAASSILLIANSLIKFDWKEIIIITITAFFILFYFYREIFS